MNISNNSSNSRFAKINLRKTFFFLFNWIIFVINGPADLKTAASVAPKDVSKR